jgi:DNA-binding response OmpR family regulator
MMESNISQIVEAVGALTPHTESAPRRILIVAGNEDIRQLGTELLIRTGYEACAAASAEDAWAALHADDYDLVVADRDMPDLSGLRLLVKLRVANMAVPVIMTTSTLPCNITHADRVIRPDATLLAPYTVTEFLGKIQELLSSNVKANLINESYGVNTP